MTEKSLLMNYVLDRTPALRYIIEKYGAMSLYEYGQKNYIGHQPSPRKAEFIEKAASYLTHKHGVNISNLITKSLDANYAVSTADHHGPIGHPFWFQAGILRGLVQTDSAIINLSTSHVSLGNSSYPRGFVLQSDTQKMSQLLLPLFPASSRMSPVFRYSAFRETNLINTFAKQLKNHLKKGYISQEKYTFLEQWIHRTLIQNEIVSQKYYSEQITLINTSMWGEIFPHGQPLITIDSEELVIALLVQALEEENPLSGLIIGRKGEEVEKNFDGISCCFDIKKRRGTYLFWYLDENNMRHALWRNGNILESPTCSVRILMEKNEVKERLQSGNLIPSGLLVYSTLAGYYGIRCFGGFAQGSYLPAAVTAYKKTTNDERGGEVTESILCEDLIFLMNSCGGITTALDMLYDTSMNGSDKLLLYAKNTTLIDAVEPVLPEIARCISF